MRVVSAGKYWRQQGVMRERWAPIGLGADGGATCAEDAGNFARKTCPGGRLVLSNAACFHDVTSWRDPFCWRTDLFHDFFFCVCACRTKPPGRIGTNAYGFGGEDSFASTGPSLERIDGYGKSWAAVSGVGMEGGLDYMKGFFFPLASPYQESRETPTLILGVTILDSAPP
ncbi:hypothetical protein VUR80DRAFT_10114 [Thermomyces stellatus]